YYIEVPNAFKELVPSEYIRKQTLANCERFITQELKELESKVLSAQERITGLEYEIFCAIRRKTADEILRIQNTARAVAELDVLCSFAHVAVANNYVCPEMRDDGKIEIKDGRHPVVELMLDGAPFVPNDTLLDCEGERCAIITGPNMAGKSTYMRQVALIVLMAQAGSFVPASHAGISIVDSIFTRVGASDDLASGQSTFMVEMSEVASILKNATSRSLIVYDEIGRGTSTFDGMSIARAVLEYSADKKRLGAKTLFATHYHELTELENDMDGVKNYNIAVKKRGDEITFLRRIVRGRADGSYGIEVAKLAGVPAPVVKRAKVILSELENNDRYMRGDAPVISPPHEDDGVQVSFGSREENEITERLKAIDVNTLTPIEALSMLYELTNKAKNI
nr:DNA mismatch repair protein MutS [Clostridiales bacterium]